MARAVVPPGTAVSWRWGAGWRVRLKDWVGRLVFLSGLYRLFFRDKAIVVLFHRIDDSLAGDPLTCSVGEFRAYCDFFRRFFVVVGLGTLLDRLRGGESIGRHLVITFDDGYQDNARVAAMELRARGLPACFFVTTGFVGTDRQAPWDLEVGARSVWMDWEEIRQLHCQGFEIGAHTVNHTDLGVTDGRAAEYEITESRRQLESELGGGVDLFSYPFGRRDSITLENRDRVRRAGFRCCASAHGGVISRAADPFDLRRVPISPWFASPYQFGFEMMLLRSESQRQKWW